MRKHCIYITQLFVLALNEFSCIKKRGGLHFGSFPPALEVWVVSVLGTEVPHVGTKLVRKPLPLHHLDLLVAVVVPHSTRQLLVVHSRVFLHLERVSIIWLAQKRSVFTAYVIKC